MTRKLEEYKSLKNIEPKTLSWTVLIVTIIALLVNHQYYFYGHFGYDDMHYARLASNSLHGFFDWGDHYNYRFTIVLTTAFSYLLFGVNDFASMLPALILSVAILGCFFLSFKNTPALFILSILLYFSFQWNLFYSDKLMPDIYVSAFSLFAWLLYEKGKSSQSILIPILSCLFLFIAFNAKGTVIVFVPLFFFYLLSDLSDKQLFFWKVFIISLIFLMLLYFAFFLVVTGDPLSRFNAIKGNHYLNPCSYAQIGPGAITRRLTVDFYNYLISNQLYVYVLILLLPILSYLREKSWVSYKESIALFILLVSVNIMPVTLNPYNPFCLEPRHSIIITPILVICSVRLIRVHFPFYSKYYLKVLLLFVGICLIWPTIKYANHCKTLHYSKFKKDLNSMVFNSNLDGDIYGSTVLKNIGEYYTGFQFDHPIRFKEYKDLNCLDSALVCRNWYSEWHAGLSDESVLNILENAKCHSLTEVVYTSPQKDFWIYKTTNSK